MNNLEEAANLARWLIIEKHTAFTTAYIIAARKFKIKNWHEVQKYYNEHLKPKQIEITYQ